MRLRLLARAQMAQDGIDVLKGGTVIARNGR